MIILKRIPAVCLAVLLLLCCAAGAENENLPHYDFEDFILQTENALSYRGNKTEIILFQRTIRITGSFGTYLFSLSAFSSDDLENASGGLVQAVQWK